MCACVRVCVCACVRVRVRVREREREMCSRIIPFKAIRGGGAFLNGKPISVSSASEIGQAVVSTNIGYGRSREVTDFMLGNVRVLLEHNVRGLRMTGSGTAPSTPHASL